MYFLFICSQLQLPGSRYAAKYIDLVKTLHPDVFKHHWYERHTATTWAPGVTAAS